MKHNNPVQLVKLLIMIDRHKKNEKRTGLKKIGPPLNSNSPPPINNSLFMIPNFFPSSAKPVYFWPNLDSATLAHNYHIQLL